MFDLIDRHLQVRSLANRVFLSKRVNRWLSSAVERIGRREMRFCSVGQFGICDCGPFRGTGSREGFKVGMGFRKK